MTYPSHQLPGRLYCLLLQPMASGQNLQPFGNIKIHLCHRKFFQNLFQNPMNIFPLQLLTIDRHYRHGMLLLELSCQACRFFRIRTVGIEKHQKWLADILQLLNCRVLCRYVCFPLQISKRAIRGYYNPDGGMILDNLTGTDLRRLGKRDLFFKPRSLHQTFSLIFYMTGSAIYHETHTVNQPHLGLNSLRRLYQSGFLGNELWLCSHDGLPCRALGQLIPCLIFPVLILHLRKHQLFHKTLDKG